MAIRSQNTSTDQDRAEALALDILVFIAGREDDLGRFLGEAGIAPDELRARASDPEMLAGVMDFLLNNEALLIEFAAERELDPFAPQRARRHLPGWSEP